MHLSAISAPVTLDGAPAEFAVGASVRAASGLQCGEALGGAIRVYTGESSHRETYDITGGMCSSTDRR